MQSDDNFISDERRIWPGPFNVKTLNYEFMSSVAWTPEPPQRKTWWEQNTMQLCST